MSHPYFIFTDGSGAAAPPVGFRSMFRRWMGGVGVGVELVVEPERDIVGKYHPDRARYKRRFREEAERSRRMMQEYLDEVEKREEQARRKKLKRIAKIRRIEVTEPMLAIATREELQRIVESQAALQRVRDHAQREIDARIEAQAEFDRLYWHAFMLLALHEDD